MRAAAAAVLLALAGAACRKAPPSGPTPEALGAELATYRQVFAPLSPETAASFRLAVEQRGPGNVRSADVATVYAEDAVVVAGSTVPVLVAYSGLMIMPTDVIARPMNVTQFLRDFGDRQNLGGALLVTPKGRIFVPRSQYLDVLIETRKAGAPDEELPYTVVAGSVRR